VDLDRWAIARTRELQDEVVAAYRNYDFHLIYQKVHNFCVVDMGGFYLDVIKDRLYTTPAMGRPRRSAQTAMQAIVEAMVRWLAPILSFTAEEIWRHMPGERPESVFFSTWAQLPDGTARGSAIQWPAVLELRSAVRTDRRAARRRRGHLCHACPAVVPGTAGGRTQVRAHHVGGPRSPGRGPSCRCRTVTGGWRGDGLDPRPAVDGDKVRPLLAQAGRRGLGRRASRTLRALRGQCGRTRRDAAVCLR
jgi:hypothetical protein